MNEHFITLKRMWDGQWEWACHSSWDAWTPNSRLRTPMGRTTFYRTEREARRWAKKYKVECPSVPKD